MMVERQSSPLGDPVIFRYVKLLGSIFFTARVHWWPACISSLPVAVWFRKFLPPLGLSQICIDLWELILLVLIFPREIMSWCFVIPNVYNVYSRKWGKYPFRFNNLEVCKLCFFRYTWGDFISSCDTQYGVFAQWLCKDCCKAVHSEDVTTRGVFRRFTVKEYDACKDFDPLRVNGRGWFRNATRLQDHELGASHTVNKSVRPSDVSCNKPSLRQPGSLA